MTYADGIAAYCHDVVSRPDTRPRTVALRESVSVLHPAPTAQTTTSLDEALPPAPAGSVRLVKIISADVQGASGYYPAQVLRRDGPRVFPAGTHVYMNHPGRFESDDLPERSVRDLAGVLVEEAYYADAPQGSGLYAPVRFFSDFADMVAERAPWIGMSIRAQGLRRFDADTGRDVVTELLAADSVDIVTRPGAGGAVLGEVGPYAR